MNEEKSYDQEIFDDDQYLFEESSSDESAKKDSIPSISRAGYLSSAHETVELKNLKKTYVENMKRLIRTCHKEVANLKKEKDTALQRLASREASRIKPEKVEKGEKENSLLLSFKNSNEMNYWITLHRINVEGVSIKNGIREDKKSKEEVKHIRMESKNMCMQPTENQFVNEESRPNDEKRRSEKKESGKSDGDFEDGLSNDDESLMRRRRRSPSREIKRRRDEDEKLRKIEEKRRQESYLKRRIEIQKYKKNGSNGRILDDNRRNRH